MSRGVKQEREVQRMREERHIYLSTACYHGQHSECRKECKFCSAWCVCTCHPVHRTPRL